MGESRPFYLLGFYSPDNIPWLSFSGYRLFLTRCVITCDLLFRLFLTRSVITCDLLFRLFLTRCVITCDLLFRLFLTRCLITCDLLFRLFLTRCVISCDLLFRLFLTHCVITCDLLTFRFWRIFGELYVLSFPGFLRFFIYFSVKSVVMWVGNNVVYTNIAIFQMNIVYWRKIKNRKKVSSC